MKGRQIRIMSLLALDTIFFILEITIGYLSHSLALIADSFHMLNDIFSLVVALWAVKVAKDRDPDAKYTYGWKRAEILGALVNAVFLMALCFSICIEAIQRLVEPQEINNPKLVMYIGITGLISNVVGLFLFHESDDFDHDHHHDIESGINDSTENAALAITDRTVRMLASEETPLIDGDTAVNTPVPQMKKQKSLNMHGLFLHVLGDALGNIGVISAALFIWKTDFSWRFYFDPAVSLFITAIIFSSALPLSRKASRILLQATPSTISAEVIRSKIEKLNGVVQVHDFHIWNLTESITIASIHVKIDLPADKYEELAKLIRNIFHDFGIHSATVQPEFVSGNITASERRRFSIIAGGEDSKIYGSTNNHNCIIDKAINCSQDHCVRK